MEDSKDTAGQSTVCQTNEHKDQLERPLDWAGNSEQECQSSKKTNCTDFHTDDKHMVGKHVCDIGHEDRQELERVLELPRTVQPLKDYKMKINLGPGNVKKTSVKELAEEFKASEVGQLLLNGGSLTVPVVDYVKDKFDLTSVETLERMQHELVSLSQELISDGFSKEDVTLLVKRDNETMKRVSEEMAKKAVGLYNKYQKLQSEMAEIIVKEAAESLKLSSLIIRSVSKDDVWKKCKQVYERSGLEITKPGRKDEYDIQLFYLDGNDVGLIYIEVKNGNSYPWDLADSPPKPSLFEGNLQEVKRNPSKKRTLGSWGQLGKSHTFISQLFSDIPFGKVQAFTALPYTSRAVLEDRLGPSCCMPWVIFSEDLRDPTALRTKLGLNTIAEATPAARAKICEMSSRMIGPGSGLYVDIRDPAQVKYAEEKRLKEEVNRVDTQSWILLDSIQAKAVEEAEDGQQNVIAIEGAPGSGKTTAQCPAINRDARNLNEMSRPKSNFPLSLFSVIQLN